MGLAVEINFSWHGQFDGRCNATRAQLRFEGLALAASTSKCGKSSGCSILIKSQAICVA